jgi:single-strand DNA-binding protein
MGNLTRDPEVRKLNTGTSLCDIGIAVTESHKNSSGAWIEETSFIDVTAWGRTAEVIGEYLTKGSPIFIEGRLKLDTWEKDGQKRSKLKVICEKMRMLGKGQEKKPKQQDTAYSQPVDENPFTSEPAESCDIQF